MDPLQTLYQKQLRIKRDIYDQTRTLLKALAEGCVMNPILEIENRHVILNWPGSRIIIHSRYVELLTEDYSYNYKVPKDIDQILIWIRITIPFRRSLPIKITI